MTAAILTYLSVFALAVIILSGFWAMVIFFLALLEPPSRNQYFD